MKKELNVMNKIIKKSWVIMLLILGVQYTGMGQTYDINFAGGPEVTISGQTVYTEVLPVLVSFSDDNTTGSIEITVPESVIFSPATPNITADAGIVISNPVVSGPSGGVKTLTFDFSTTLAGAFGVNISGLKFPDGDFCVDMEYNLSAVIKDEQGNVQATTDPFKYIVNTINTNFNISMGFSTGTDCRGPLQVSFAVNSYYSQVGGNTQQIDSKIIFNYDPANFSVYAVGGRFTNSTTAEYSPESYQIISPGTIEIINTAHSIRTYVVYLIPNNCNADLIDQNFSAVLSSDLITCYDSQASITQTIDQACCGTLGEEGAVPRIYNTQFIRCIEECVQRLVVKINNMTTGTDYTNLIYTVQFPFDVENVYLSLTNGTLTDLGNNTYQVNLSLLAGYQDVFYVHFSISDPSSISYPYANPTPEEDKIQQTLEDGNTSPVELLDEANYDFGFLTTNCDPSLKLEERELAQGQNVSMLNGEEVFNVELKLYNTKQQYGVTNFSYDFLFNEYLYFNSNVTIEYYYGTTQNPSSGQFAPMPAINYTILPNNVGINFSGIDFPSSCGSTVYYIVRLSLKSYEDKVSGNKNNWGISATSGVSMSFSAVNWVYLGTPGTDVYTKGSCSFFDVDPTEETFTLAATDKIYYHYVLNNYGATDITNPKLVGSLPHNGDLFFRDNSQRNSGFTLGCPSDLKVWKRQVLNGVVTLQEELDPNDYELIFTNDVSNLCLNDIDPNLTGSCTDPSANTCGTTPVFFKLKLNGEIDGYTKLVVSFETSVVGTASVGSNARGSFLANWDEFFNSNIDPIENTPSIGLGVIEIAETGLCGISACIECENSFAPIPGRDYVISAWVKESNMAGAVTYSNVNLSLFFEAEFDQDDVQSPKYYATGEIIDGWQRIEQVFTVPVEAVKIKVQLNNDGANNVYFDDIRVHPFNANMKSFVYDPITRRLMAELDERNYATFYEYDEEGALIRVKKETAKGVMTIQESRNATYKQGQ